VFSSIEEYLGHNTQAYYDVLAEVGERSWHPERDAWPWVRFCLTAHYQQAQTVLHRTDAMRRLWDGIEHELKERKLPERTLLALVDAAMGHKIRNTTYRRAADITHTLASRDLKQLVDSGLLEAQGEKRGRYYLASEPLHAIRRRNEIPAVELEDPFATAPRP
jgi:Fic family protein